jgi:hypothetical protein
MGLVNHDCCLPSGFPSTQTSNGVNQRGGIGAALSEVKHGFRLICLPIHHLEQNLAG